MEKHYRINELAEMYGIHRSTLHDWIRKGLFPAGVLVGGRIRLFPASQVDAWMAAQRQEQGGEVG